MRALSKCAALLVLMTPASVSAQPVPITESDLLSRITESALRVQAIQSAIDVARADVLAASRWPNPRVTFDREAAAGVTENIATVGQILPITGRRGLEIRAASALVEASASRAADEVRRLRADARLVFTTLVFAQQREQEISRSTERLRELVTILDRRETAGEAAGFDRLRAERELIEVEADRSAAAADRLRTRALLASYVAGANAGEFTAVPTAVRRSDLPSLEELIAQADRTRGELAALQHDQHAAEFAASAADRRVVPEPEIIAGSKSSTAANGDVGTLISIQASIPLFDRGKAERAAARARASQASARLTALRASLNAQIAALRATVIERRAAADRHRNLATASADQVEHIAQVSYEAGERGILELLDAYRTASAARVRQLALDAAVREAEIELEFVSGWEMP